MKHALAIVFAFLLAAVGVLILAANYKQLTIPVLVAGVGCLLVSTAIAIPVEFKSAVEAIKPLATLRKDIQ